MKKLFAFSALSLSLAACAAPESSQTPAGISYSFVNHFNAGETAKRAQEHCQKYGKNAQAQNNFGSAAMQTFHCVD